MRKSTHHHHHPQQHDVQINEQGYMYVPQRVRLGTRLQKQLGEDPQHQDKWSQYYQTLKQYFKMRDSEGNTQRPYNHQPVGDFVLGRLGFDVLVRYDVEKKWFYLSRNGVKRLHDLVKRGIMFNIRLTRTADKIADTIADKIADTTAEIEPTPHNILFWFCMYLLMFRTKEPDTDTAQSNSKLLKQVLNQVNVVFGRKLDFHPLEELLHQAANYMSQPNTYKQEDWNRWLGI